jgi:allantoin racemase
MKILVIIPVVGTHFNEQIAEHIKETIKNPDAVSFDIVNLEAGSTFIATDEQRSVAAKKVVAICQNLPLGYYQGVFVCTFTGVGVNECREFMTIPVMGAGQAAIIQALQVADNFAVVAAVADQRNSVYSLVEQYGWQQQFTGFYHINTPIITLANNNKDCLPTLIEQSIVAVSDGANAIVLACTGIYNEADKDLQVALQNHFGRNIAVIHPTIEGFRYLQELVG